ncbi:MAG: pyridoxamine 5'-phosphate oxidase family protein [Coriobacteriales bacterium]|jgi:uncharacterized pyridoxamine 5'-phosphate oxidase family protein|nr:pyridoxamine 5'-phosphate oxidase family protein [Coriobacteriales bacterium]
MDEVYDFLKEAKTYFLATADGDQPRVRAFGTIDKYNGKLYIQTGKSKDVSHQIAKNPKVELCATKGLDWIRVSCTLVDDPDVEAKRHMLDAYPDLKAMYSAEDDNTQVLYMTDATATFASLASPDTHTVTF